MATSNIHPRLRSTFYIIRKKFIQLSNLLGEERDGQMVELLGTYFLWS